MVGVGIICPIEREGSLAPVGGVGECTFAAVVFYVCPENAQVEYAGTSEGNGVNERESIEDYQAIVDGARRDAVAMTVMLELRHHIVVGAAQSGELAVASAAVVKVDGYTCTVA